VLNDCKELKADLDPFGFELDGGLAARLRYSVELNSLWMRPVNGAIYVEAEVFGHDSFPDRSGCPGRGTRPGNPRGQRPIRFARIHWANVADPDAGLVAAT